jgi:pyruvate ferredoxin oxidoreductase alpha subunit
MADAMSGDVLEQNLEVLHDAYEQVSDMEHSHDLTVPEGEHNEEQILVSGSHGIAYAAIDAGCRFIAGYPMTPWTDVFTIMTNLLPEMGGISEQVEDEIAAASLAVGASHAGAKAMSGSSGGGFALMSEPLGLAEMTETPLVLLEAQRAGPSTGMPTKPEQADLNHILYTSQGDSHRVAFGPSDPKECYEQTRTAFEIAYEYQVPSIVVYDQKLSGEYRNVDASFFDREPDPDLGSTLTEAELEDAPHDDTGKFHRFQQETDDGVSPRSIPGQKGGRYLASGNEHWPNGHIAEDPDNRTMQVERRLQKLESIRADLDERDQQVVYGDEDADFGLIVWGSQQGTVEEAVERLNGDGNSVKALGVSDLAPFPVEAVSEFVDSVEEAIVVEMSATKQFRGLIQKEVGDFGGKLSSLLKYNGNPFEPAEIVEAVEIEQDGGGEDPTAQTTLEPAAGD